MQIATAHVKLNANSTLVKRNLTPAEVVILNTIHRVNGGSVSKIIIERDIQRSHPEELERLRSTYGPALSEVYPGAAPTFPLTFESAGLSATERTEPEPTSEPLTRLAVPEEWLANDAKKADDEKA